MKTIYIATIILFLFGCETKKNDHARENHNQSFYVGTYTNCESQGIYKYLLNDNGKLKQIGLVARSKNPSFLAMTHDNKFIVAVNEININNTGTVESFLITKDSLEFISKSPSGGAHPCFVAINNNGFILTANYTGGNVGLLRIDTDGKLSSVLDVQVHNGHGITERQEGPHAHSAWFKPCDDEVISIDLGTNELWFSYIDTMEQELIPGNQQKLKMKLGAGPRHLAFHPTNNCIYILNELNNSITLVRKSIDQKYMVDSSVSTLPQGFSNHNTSADIHISSDGNFVYTSNRGHNSIAIYKVNENDGTLTLIDHQPTLGDSPRNFSITPDEEYLLVANQNTNNIVSFKRNRTTGLLSYVDQIKAPTPVCILF